MGNGSRADCFRVDLTRQLPVWMGKRAVRSGMGVEISKEVRIDGNGGARGEFYADVPGRSRPRIYYSQR